MRIPTRIAWIGATAVGYALGMTLSTVLVGATARPLSPVLGGIIVVLAYGAVIGMFVGAAQSLAIPRGLAPWSVWIVATLLGAAVGFAVAAVVGEALGTILDPSVNVVIAEGVIEMTSGAIVGLAIGSAQWLVVRRSLPRRRVWLLTSAVGAAFGYGIAAAVLELFDVPVLKASLVPSFGAILGLFVGLAQGLGGWSGGSPALPATRAA